MKERACDIFPLIDGDEFQALKRDIAEHGQREPIIYVDGEIIDGRNRLRACEELGIEPKVRNLTAAEAGDTFALVMSLNFHRRHLKPHEKGAALKAFMDHVGAKKQQGKRTDRTSPKSGEVAPTLAAVAQKLGVAEQTARDQIKAAEDYAAAAPEVRAKVDAGEITPKQARIETERKEGRDIVTTKAPREPKKKSDADIVSDFAQAVEEAIYVALQQNSELKTQIIARLRMILQRY